MANFANRCRRMRTRRKCYQRREKKKRAKKLQQQAAAAAEAALNTGECSTATESNASALSDLQISTTSESEMSQRESRLADLSGLEGVYPLSSTPKKCTKRSKPCEDEAALQRSHNVCTPSKRAMPNRVEGSPALKVRRGPNDKTFSRKEPIIINENHYRVSLF
jgi:hypothetical protein